MKYQIFKHTYKGDVCYTVKYQPYFLGIVFPWWRTIKESDGHGSKSDRVFTSPMMVDLYLTTRCKTEEIETVELTNIWKDGHWMGKHYMGSKKS